MTPKFHWSDESVTQLHALAATGHTASMIAGIFGTSRNAVIGKCHRIGVQLPGRAPLLERVKAWDEKKAKAAEPPKPAKAAKSAKPAPPRPALRVIVCEPAPEGGVVFMDLEPHHCRWPLGGPKQPAVKFCGARKASGKVYCATHVALAYAPRPKAAAPKPFNFTTHKTLPPRLKLVAAE